MAASLLLPLAFLSITPALSAVPRPGAVDDATLLPFAGFAPRWYDTEGMPAVPVSPNPRHAVLGGLVARDASICDPGFHSCVEANGPATCCPNDRYCYLDEHWETKCCPLGVKCDGSLCAADELYCNRTSSTTIPVTTTTGRGNDNTVTSFVSYTTFAACCNRACSGERFSCEKAFGGQCCSYGFKCASIGLCIADPVQSTSISASTTAPDFPPGCTTSQFSCAETDGGGCCNTGSICTYQTIGATTSKVCALDPSFTSSSGGLPSGAKAGIGVGVAVGAATVIAAVTWLCIRRRQKRSGTTGTNASAHEMRQSMGAGGTEREDAGDSLLVGIMTPGRSPLTERGTDWAPSHEQEHGRYHYGDVRAGPYRDREGDGQMPPNPSLATTPPAGSVPSDGGGRFAASMPFGPDHIRIPVEIGGAETQKEMARSEGNGRVEEMPGNQGDSPEGRFELMGSLGTPSPLNPDGEVNPMDKGPK
ncbi:hypothetical protein F5B22DRAFT_327812 [Xylaria bambusicola]|uniref:uncharacterized protein n=1 Tax=Xylaria bambusicola TaxID=326684 RepID=UPI002007780C|nr:uncharacterized protein F5B22DRAFT_327812 [Xylaria bambusicola]KAI0509395.1 hypothetical protein F5B22DRAFT_327812 [Xylaria bambusicola]